MSGAAARSGLPRPSGRSAMRGPGTRSPLRSRTPAAPTDEPDVPGTGGSGSGPGPSGRSGRGSLRVVPQTRRRVARGPFLVGVVVVLGVGLLSLLGLNTLLAQDSFHLHALQVSSKQLADQEQDLQRQVDTLQAPAALAAAAQAQGMVLGGPPAFLRLPDGVVLGDPEPATSPPAPPPVTPDASTGPGSAAAAGTSASPRPTTPSPTRPSPTTPSPTPTPPGAAR